MTRGSRVCVGRRGVARPAGACARHASGVCVGGPVAGVGPLLWREFVLRGCGGRRVAALGGLVAR